MDSTAHGTCIDNRTIHDITTSHRSRYMPAPRWLTNPLVHTGEFVRELFITTLQVILAANSSYAHVPRPSAMDGVRSSPPVTLEQQQAVEVLERRNRAKQSLIRRALAESMDPKYATVSVDEPVRCRCSTQ